ncbi:MAG: D-glycero-beta-D-manno-heptose 1-phosphate adenylyltransferase [Thermomicrobiales bacterium]
MSATGTLVQRFRDLRALVLGDAMLDSYLSGRASRLCSEGPAPVVQKTAEERLPGGAANTAANLRALGADVCFAGVTGADAAGALLRAALHERGVTDRWLLADDTLPTLHKLRILAGDQYLVRFDEGERYHFGVETHARLLAHLDDAFARCDVVVISDYRYGAVTDAAIARLRELRRQRPSVPLVVDSKELRRFRDVGATVIAPNHEEARLAVDPTVAPAGPARWPEAERLAHRLLTLADARFVAITLAEQGVCLLERGSVARHLPAHLVPGAHDVGAGDTFTAALALALAAGAGCEAAVQLGIDAAGIAVTKPRTATVAASELLHWAELRDGALPPGVGALAARLAAARQAGRRIVFTNGVFDILHTGHIELLRQAKALGDLLVVGVNSDASVRRLKGPGRPINHERDRLALVAALDAVDHALLFDDDTPAGLIHALRPHVHVKGGDYASAALPEAAAVREAGGQIVILPLVAGRGTTQVIDRVLSLAVRPPRELEVAP